MQTYFDNEETSDDNNSSQLYMIFAFIIFIVIIIAIVYMRNINSVEADAKPISDGGDVLIKDPTNETNRSANSSSDSMTKEEFSQLQKNAFGVNIN